MTDPNLYWQSRGRQTENAKWFLDKIAHQLNYKNEEKILDVGSGPGDLIASIRKSHFPKDSTIVGADICEEMLQMARSRYEEEGLTFKLLDISSPNIWMNWLKEFSSFDKIFSSHCLQWVTDIKQAVENFNMLLKNGGDLITISVLNAPYLKLFRTFYNDPQLAKFKPLMKNMALINGGTNIELYVKCLKSSGFEIISSEVIEFHWSHPNEAEWRMFADSISPCLPLLKDEEKKAFSDKSAKFLLENGLVNVTTNGTIDYSFEVFALHARKVHSLVVNDE